MTTATADTVHAASRPDPDEMIRTTVRALRSAHQIDTAVIARHLGISRQSLYNRLNGHAPWLAAEVAALADFFQCDVQDFYNGTVRLDRPFVKGGPAPGTPARRNPPRTRATRRYTHGSEGAVVASPHVLGGRHRQLAA